jgi:hypothetical protein
MIQNMIDADLRPEAVKVPQFTAPCRRSTPGGDKKLAEICINQFESKKSTVECLKPIALTTTYRQQLHAARN